MIKNEDLHNYYPILNKDTTLHISPNGGVLYSGYGMQGEFINKSAREILVRSNGTNNIYKIISELADLYNESQIKVNEIVQTFIKTNIERNYIELNKKPINNSTIRVTGSTSFFTPVAVIFELTSKCNFSCKHCYLGKQTAKQDLTTAQIINCLDQLYNIGITSIQLTGGEPFIQPDFLDIFKFCSDHFNHIAITTNGSLIDDVIAKEISKYYFKNNNSLVFQISLDGPQDVHNKIRGVGTFEQTVMGISNLINNKVPVKATMTLNNINKYYLEEEILLAKKLKIWMIDFANTISVGNAFESNELLIPLEERLKIAETILKLKTKYETDDFFIPDWSPIKLPEWFTLQGAPINCGLGSHSVSIGSNGDVYPCAMIRKPIGNIKLEKFNDIFSKEIITTYSKLKDPDDAMCKDCEKKDLCSNCIALALHNSKDVPHCKWKSNWESQMKESI